MRDSGAYQPGDAYLHAVRLVQTNAGQLRVLESKGNCAVLAGPGSGKTRCITIKAANLLATEVHPPRGVACLTYNTECAREIERRMGDLGVHPTNGLFVGTVHGFCFKHIVQPYARLAGVQISEPVGPAARSEQLAALAEAKTQVWGQSGPSNLEALVTAARRTRVLARVRRESANVPVSLEASDEEAAKVCRAAILYTRTLRDRGLVDYEDMVLLALQLVALKDWVRASLVAKFPVLVVDEYQDLGPILHELVWNLVSKTTVRLIAVGDPDQSIYGFDGADPALLLNLATRSDFERITLPLNYRCGQTILHASEAALGESRNYRPTAEHRGTVDLYGCPGGLAEQADRAFLQIIPEALTRRIEGRSARTLADIALLYADKNDGDVIAEAASRHGYAYQRIDKNAPYPKTQLSRWVEHCAAWCAGGWSECNPLLSTLISQWRSYGEPTAEPASKRSREDSFIAFLVRNRQSTESGDDVAVADWLEEFWTVCLDAGLPDRLRTDERAELLKIREVTGTTGKLAGMSLTRFAGQRGAPDHVNLLTLHSAKGLEFDVVIILGADEGRMPSWSDSSDSEIREARRRFYVGLTRARAEVHITYSGFTVNKYGRRFAKGPSRFLIEIREMLKLKNQAG